MASVFHTLRSGPVHYDESSEHERMLWSLVISRLCSVVQEYLTVAQAGWKRFFHHVSDSVARPISTTQLLRYSLVRIGVISRHFMVIDDRK